MLLLLLLLLLPHLLPRNELEKRSGVVTGPCGSNWIQIFVIELPGGPAEAASYPCQPAGRPTSWATGRADRPLNLPVKSGCLVASAY
jgi:hypothetical protein